jgi:hypothetical protein
MIDAAAFGAALIGGDAASVRRYVSHAARVEAFGAERVGSDSVLTSRPAFSDASPIATTASLNGARFSCAVLQAGADAYAAFTRNVGDFLERAWIVGPRTCAPSAFLGLAAPHDPRMSQMAPLLDLDSALHPTLNATHAMDLRSVAPLAVAEVWRAERIQISVCEAFSTAAGWAALLRVQGETPRVDGAVIQIGAWGILLNGNGASACIVDEWEPDGRRAAAASNLL